MVVELRRYIGDTLSVQVHDADRERTRCRLSEIEPAHRRWYDSLDEAFADIAYRECSWCLGGSSEGESEGEDEGEDEDDARATGTSRGTSRGTATD